ncbi:hypothetical protein LX87_05557 [Larkinella arboricola]|uniref:Uncharacterized protein n=1 Tax=Larkinella arboricola TaxID=643671 RepID=A0A327WGP1_LARAB|nr:hypothetical protein [Larkinella arboricola]RAJ90031.1 hypothetical protein LX87_05557 [Larkinella arboricola]
MNTSVDTLRNTFVKQWLGSHLVTLYGGLGLAFPLIAHGITGPHGVYLNPAQLVAHTIGLLVVAIVTNYSQNRVLTRFFGPSLPSLNTFYLLALPTVFWISYYAFYIPYDILFGLYLLPVLSLWWKLMGVVARPGWLLALGMLIALVGFVLAFACVMPIIPWWQATFGNRLSADVFFWCYLITVGLLPTAACMGLLIQTHLPHKAAALREVASSHASWSIHRVR